MRVRDAAARGLPLPALLDGLNPKEPAETAVQRQRLFFEERLRDLPEELRLEERPDDFFEADFFEADFFDADFLEEDFDDFRPDDLRDEEAEDLRDEEDFLEGDFFAEDFFADDFFADDFFAVDFFEEAFPEEDFREPPLDFGAGGTFPPSRRASERPIAIACSRLVTFFPLPLRSLPRFRSCIFSSTSSDAFRPYFAISLLLSKRAESARRGPSSD